jgi:multidrug efflux pump subunit AcrB
VTISFNLAPGVALGEAIDQIQNMERQLALPATITPGFSGTAQVFQHADMYGPPAAGGTLPFVSPNAVALYRNVKRLKLDVATHVPIHGNPGSQGDFERIVGPEAARAPQVGGGG